VQEAYICIRLAFASVVGKPPVKGREKPPQYIENMASLPHFYPAFTPLCPTQPKFEAVFGGGFWGVGVCVCVCVCVVLCCVAIAALAVAFATLATTSPSRELRPRSGRGMPSSRYLRGGLSLVCTALWPSRNCLAVARLCVALWPWPAHARSFLATM